jgi:hypothetical protein
LFGDLKAVAGIGSFEDHVLDEMGNPILFRHLIPGTDREPDSKRNRPAIRKSVLNRNACLSVAETNPSECESLTIFNPSLF